jgi:hypothetical protein
MVFFSPIMKRSIPETNYFPVSLLDEQPKADQLIWNGFSSTLQELDEPSIWERSKGGEAHCYRFLWIGTWAGSLTLWLSFSVRVEFSADGRAQLCGRASWVEFGDSATPWGSGLPKIVSTEQSEEFLGHVAASEFWTLPTCFNRIGVDGANWVFEGCRDGTYHVVRAWCPPVGPVRDLGLYFLSLSSIPIDTQKLY